MPKRAETGVEPTQLADLQAGDGRLFNDGVSAALPRDGRVLPSVGQPGVPASDTPLSYHLAVFAPGALDERRI